MYKDVNDNKTKTYYDQKISFEDLLQIPISGRYLCWKRSSGYFDYLYFCFILGFLGLFAYSTAFLHASIF